MKRALCSILAVIFVLVAFPALAAQARDWDDSCYAKFTPETFAAYRPANKEIDFKSVDHDLISAAIFYETNAQRIKEKKKPLLYSPALREAAFGHAKDMVEKNFHAHENPDDPKKKTLADRLALVGITRCLMSENIAHFPGRQYPVTKIEETKGQVEIDPEHPAAPYTYVGLAQQLLEGWMRSPGHRRNILAEGMVYIGCGACHCQRELLSAQGQVIKVDYFKACQNFASTRGPDPAKK